jgi:hypothetical protein
MNLPIDITPPRVPDMTFPQFCEKLRALRGRFRLRHGDNIRHRRKRDWTGAFLCPIEAVILADNPNYHPNNTSADIHGVRFLGLSLGIAERIVKGADGDRCPSYRRAMLKALELSEEPG